MKTVITGGIGSGKSYVCQRLQARGIAVYDCDAAAKRLMRSSQSLQQQLRQLIGPEVYAPLPEGQPGEYMLVKRVLAQFLLTSESHALAVDNIVHPAVASDFIASGLQWIESAIFFESGFFRRIHVDRVVCVTAPLETRISRVMQRDGISRAKTLEWMGRQLQQEEVVRRSDVVIVNDGQADLEAQLDRLLAPDPVPPA